MNISAGSRYGLRAMAYLAKLGGVCSVKKVAQDESIPFDYLEKIFSKLEKKGLIVSKRGASGGYSLAYSPKKITVGQVIKVLEGKTNFVFCIAKDQSKECSCSRAKKCLTKNVWQKVQDTLNLTLNSITLADLIIKKYDNSKKK